MKVAEVQDDFVRIYGYKQNMWKADDLVKRFIAVAESNPSEEILREVNTKNGPLPTRICKLVLEYSFITILLPR